MIKRKCHRIVVLLLALLLFSPCLQAQNDDTSFGGWHFVELDHKFGESKWSGMLYFEHENYQYQRLDCWFLRTSVKYKAFSWLKLALGYDYLKIPMSYGNRMVCDAVGSLSEGHLSTSLRFRCLHTWYPELGTEGNELRTRLIVAYSFDKVPLTPYVAVEIFTWVNEWRRSRNYIGCTYDFNKHVQIEGFYMLVFSHRAPEHIIGLGMNFNL